MAICPASSSISSAWSLQSVLEHVLAHLDPADVACLRLTARAFRHHPAVLRSCQHASAPTVGSIQAFQSGMSFLQLLPQLRVLTLTGCKTLFGMEKLTQLCVITINGNLQQPLDLYPLSRLPSMQNLYLFGCAAERLANLSELTPLTLLTIEQVAMPVDLSTLTNLEILRVHRQPNEDAASLAFNWSAYHSLSSVTSLTDNALCCSHVDSMTQLSCLELSSPLSSLGSVPRMVGLRALGLNLGGPEHSLPGGPDGGLQPLTTLTQLKRLQLTGLPLPIPGLPALQELTLMFEYDGGVFPTVAEPHVLAVLHLRPCGALTLPDLSQFPELVKINVADDAGELYTNPRQVPYTMEYVDEVQQLDLFLEIDDS